MLSLQKPVNFARLSDEAVKEVVSTQGIIKEKDYRNFESLAVSEWLIENRISRFYMTMKIAYRMSSESSL